MAFPPARALVLGTLVVTFAAMAGHALAQPQVPATFYGTASIDGQPVADGTEVRAYIAGKDCTQLGPNYRTTVRNGPVAEYVVQVVHESQEPGCGAEGREVSFTIDGRTANETATWKAGVQLVNLNAGSGSPQPLPSPTPTPALDPTSVAATATESALFTPRPTEDGPPPTDDVTIPIGGSTRTAVPGATTTLPPTTGEADGGGAPLLGAVLLVLALLIGLGSAAGIAMGRARRRGP